VQRNFHGEVVIDACNVGNNRVTLLSRHYRLMTAFFWTEKRRDMKRRMISMLIGLSMFLLMMGMQLIQ